MAVSGLPGRKREGTSPKPTIFFFRLFIHLERISLVIIYSTSICSIYLSIFYPAFLSFSIVLSISILICCSFFLLKQGSRDPYCLFCFGLHHHRSSVWLVVRVFWRFDCYINLRYGIVVSPMTKLELIFHVKTRLVGVWFVLRLDFSFMNISISLSLFLRALLSSDALEKYIICCVYWWFVSNRLLFGLLFLLVCVKSVLFFI